MVANAKKDELSLTPMLNAYPDSLGGTLSDIADLLESSCKDAFGAFYILPSVFNTDLDRGFSVVDYSLNELLERVLGGLRRDDAGGIYTADTGVLA